MILKEINPHTKYYFAGTCVNSFDDDTGECVFRNYSSVSDFAVGEENATRISKEKFLNNVVSHDVLKTADEFMYDKDNDVFIAYDSKSDIHFFFIG